MVAFYTNIFDGGREWVQLRDIQILPAENFIFALTGDEYAKTWAARAYARDTWWN